MGRSGEICNAFLQSCSVKVIPKIIKSDTPLLKVLWTLAFLFGLLFGLYQTAIIIQSYLAYATRTLVRVQEAPSGYTFPDITVCKINPQTLVGEAENKTYKDYYDKVEYAIVQAPDDYTKEALRSIKGIFGFHRNIEISNDAVEKNLKDFVSYCKLLKATKSITCPQWDYIFLTPSYPNCVIFKQGNHTEINTWSAVFYLDDFNPNFDSKFYKYPKAKYHSGIQLFMHNTNDLPDLSTTYIAGPGMETFFEMEEIRMNSEPHPYSDCLEEDEGEHYSFDGCMATCVTAETIQLCGCLNPDIPTKEAYGLHGVPYCGHLYPNISKTAEQVHCWEDSVLKLATKCRKKCKLGCSAIHYNIKTVSVPWPHPSRHAAFYFTFIREKPEIYGKKFDILDNFTSTWHLDNEKGYQRFLSSNLLTRNFVKVTVNWAQTSWRYDKEPAMTTSLMTGSIGGLLNLWIGITFITAVEVVELFMRLLGHGERKSNQPEKNMSEMVERDDRRNVYERPI